MTHAKPTPANLAQQQAITTIDGPLLIIAGPGSGKTFTLVERVVHLITHRQVQPEQLFVVTFTDKAAQELTSRIAQRLYELRISFNLNEMYLGTFHAICLRWLQEFREFTRLKHNFTLFDQFDQQYFLYQHLRDYEDIPGLNDLIDSKSPWDRSKQLLERINLVSEEFLDCATLQKDSNPLIAALGACAARYRDQIEEANALDFSTIQFEALTLLRAYPQVRDALRQRIAYLMVDEYQDTNTIQGLILRELAPGDAPNLCVVGDDDQGLYRFRGATIRNILQFAEQFPAGVCQQITLSTNYRSHPDIIAFYNRWMGDQEWTHAGQPYRYPKQIEPRKDTFPDGPVVLRVGASTPEGWQREVLAFLHGLRDAGTLTNWNQVAFLFRSVKNDQVRALANDLEQNGIPVYSPRANQFFEREEISLMIGALLFLFPQYSSQVESRCPSVHLGLLRQPVLRPLRRGASQAGAQRPAHVGAEPRQESPSPHWQYRLCLYRTVLRTLAVPAL